MTYKEFQEESKEYLGSLVLYGFKVVKLVDIGEDSLDYYYDLYDVEKGAFKIGAACGITFLKGKIEWKNYDSMVYRWNLQAEVEYDKAKAT